MTSLADFCQTDQQRSLIEAYERLGSASAAGREVGMGDAAARRSIRRTKARAAKQGWSPEHDMVKTVPDGFALKGTSTLYGDDGSQKLQWVKTNIDQERQLELVREAVEAMTDELPKLPARMGRPDGADLMAFYPIADLHLGMYAWAKETGTNYDVKIARHDLCAAFDYLIGNTPPCGKALIGILGDFFHADNLLGVTEKSGHVLQMDGRMSKVMDVGIAALRQCVETALDRHAEVEVVIAPGNHDDILSRAMACMLRNVYEDEPRVSVHPGETERFYVRFGKTLIGIVHGHKTKDASLPGIMATERPKDWGAAEHRYFFRGHHHHDSRVEYNGCIVEQVRTIGGRDAYAAGGGFLARQDMKAILFDPEHGEVDRRTCSLALARKAARAAAA